MGEPHQEAYERLLVEIRAEFPRFRIIRKSQSSFQRWIHSALRCVTLGRMHSYLEGCQTTLGQRIYVTESWFERSYAERLVVLCHERIHMRQFRRYTFPGMSLLYLLVPLPFGFAYFRAHFEMQAYAESIRVSAQIHGKTFVHDDKYREHILQQFSSASYGWMWPFPGYMARWYQRQLDILDNSPG